MIAASRHVILPLCYSRVLRLLVLGLGFALVKGLCRVHKFVLIVLKQKKSRTRGKYERYMALTTWAADSAEAVIRGRLGEELEANSLHVALTIAS